MTAEPNSTSNVTNFKLTISYDGTAYSGWQSQANGNTIQQEIETAIRKVTGQSVRITGSGRTDSGVHALGQVASFQIESRLTARDIERALNANLPLDIRILKAEQAADDFCALRSAKHKRYTYILQDGLHHDVTRQNHCWFIRGKLDEAAMHTAAQALVGEHDFVSFQAAGSERATTVRRVDLLTVGRVSNEHRGTTATDIVLSIGANGFLYRMVRNIVGTLVEVGQGRATHWPAEVLAAKDRTAAGKTAPPQGLFLAEVDYE
jgi:tRNA pseudouridine38-40 synthase